MLKRDKEETFFVFADSFFSQVVGVAYWRKHCGKWQSVTWQQLWMRLLLSSCWKTTGRAGQLRIWRNTEQKWHMMKAQSKRRRENQVKLLKVHGFQMDQGR